MKDAVTQLSSFSAAGLRFRAASSIALVSLVLDLDSVPNNTLSPEGSGECKTSVIEELDLITKVLRWRGSSALSNFAILRKRAFNRNGREELPQRSQRKPRCYADAPFTSTPAHFSSRVSVAA